MSSTVFKRIGGSSRGKLAAALCLAVLMSGCMMGPKYQRPELMTMTEWRDLGDPRLEGQPADGLEWWKGLNDPVLDSLIAEAIEQNPTLQSAALRIVQARLAKTTSIFAQFPFITGSAVAAHSEFSENVKPEVEIEGGRPGPIGDPSLDPIRDQIRSNFPSVSVKPELDTYDAGFDAVWELDIWGKNRQRVRIAQESIDEAYADYDDMRVSLSAEVARVYVGIRTTDQRLVSLRRVVSTMESFAEAARERHARGEAPVTDVKLAELLAGVSKAGIPELETARRQYENSLCVLLNKSPQSLDERLGLSAAIPTAPLESAVGIPADLLRRRPDVRAAEHAAAAQAARVGMAKASILPAFALFGGIGLASSTSSEFFDSDSVRGNYGALMNIDALINYPVSVQLVRIKDAQFQEALLRYQDTVLRANMEAENNIISFLRSQDKTEILKKNVRDANEAAELTLDAYREGKVIVSVPIDALSFLVTQEDQYCQWQGAAATDYVALYKALGGGWEPRIGQELLSEEIQERMKEQADWWSFTGKYDLRTDYVRPDRHNNPEE